MTDQKEAQKRNKALERAIEAIGGNTALAKAIGVSPQAVAQWAEVPINRVAAVEAATGIPRHELRPDFYPLPFRRAVANEARRA